jgi:hypothetical protein
MLICLSPRADSRATLAHDGGDICFTATQTPSNTNRLVRQRRGCAAYFPLGRPLTRQNRLARGGRRLRGRRRRPRCEQRDRDAAVKFDFPRSYSRSAKGAPPSTPARTRALRRGFRRSANRQRRRKSVPAETPGLMRPPTATYEPRLILFLDILGLREIVADTTKDPEALRLLIAAIDAISELSTDDVPGSKQVSQFSDSIVVSYALTEQSAVFFLVNEVALTIINLAFRGFLLRGAITAGDLVHTNRHLVS